MSQNHLHDENEILKQVSEGNEKAFKILFSNYYHQLYNYIASFIKSKQVAEELVMDIFLKIWQGRDILPQIVHFNAFLFRVAHNKSIDFLRSAARDPEFVDLLWDTLQLANTSQADSSTLVHEYENKIREAISLLSPQRKKVYQLSREQDMTHDQIAFQLKLSKHTINNHIVEAQQFIRNYLSKNYDSAFLAIVFAAFKLK